MGASGTDFGSGGAYHDMATVAAFPNLDFALCKDFCHFDVAQKCAITLLVMTLNGGY